MIYISGVQSFLQGRPISDFLKIFRARSTLVIQVCAHIKHRNSAWWQCSRKTVMRTLYFLEIDFSKQQILETNFFELEEIGLPSKVNPVHVEGHIWDLFCRTTFDVAGHRLYTPALCDL